jgi:multiple sugar transport system permease protein
VSALRSNRASRSASTVSGATRSPGTGAETRPSWGPARPRLKTTDSVSAWLLLLPALVLLLGMTIAPTIYLVRASLHNETLLGGSGSFVGLQNYLNVLTNPDQWQGFARTALFVAVVVTLELVLGLLLALPLAAQSRSNRLAATLMLLPFTMTPVVAAMIWRQLLNPTNGWVAYYLDRVGLPGQIDWLGTTQGAWTVLVGVDVWQWTPFVALILMAGLQSLPVEPKEAAAVDGANGRQILRYVTIPMLMPFIAIAATFRTIQAFKSFDAFSVLTNGGPGTSTEIISLQIYRVALGSFRIGAAATLAVIFLVLLSLIVPALIRAAGRDSDSVEA